MRGQSFLNNAPALNGAFQTLWEEGRFYSLLINNVHTSHCDLQKPKLNEKTRGTRDFSRSLCPGYGKSPWSPEQKSWGTPVCEGWGGPYWEERKPCKVPVNLPQSLMAMEQFKSVVKGVHVLSYLSFHCHFRKKSIYVLWILIDCTYYVPDNMLGTANEFFSHSLQSERIQSRTK